MNKEGWLSVLFLIYFIIVSTSVSVYQYQLNSQVESMEEMKVAHNYFLAEIDVLDQFRCALLESKAKGTEIEDIFEYNLSRDGNKFIIEVEGENSEIIEVTVNMNESIIQDYRILSR